MKRVAMLMVVTMITTSFVGCGCVRRVRDRLCRGAYCGPTTASAPLMAAPVVVAPQVSPSVVYDAGCGYDPGCGAEPGCGYTTSYGGGSSYPSYPADGGMYDSGWAGGAPMEGGVLTPQPVMPGPEANQ